MTVLVIIMAVVIVLLLIAVAGTDHKTNGDPRYWAYRFTYPTTDEEWQAANTIAVALNGTQLERFRQQAHAEADDARREFEHALRAGFRADMEALQVEHMQMCTDYDQIIADRDVEIANLTRIVDELSETAPAPVVAVEPVTIAPVVIEPEPEPVAEDVASMPWVPHPTAETGVVGEVMQDHPLALGVGDDTVMDLRVAPHWLIAGATGMGKSNALNLLLCQLVQADPARINLALIDPKRVELRPYRDMPHTIAHAVDLQDSVDVLQDAVTEMDRRYKLMEVANVRTLDAYMDRTGTVVPYRIIVVDELADLMLRAGKRVEPAIQSLTQLGRAAGVFVILATQRPSVDVVTGTIKNNVVGRIAFGVPSHIDSRTILDRRGAEELSKPGQALIITGGVAAPRKFQMPYVSDDLIADIVDPDWRESA